MQVDPNLPWYRKLHWQIISAMALGLLVGLLVGEPAAKWVAWMGTLIMRLLRMIIVPLVLTSIITGVASVGSRGLGRMFSKTMGYYVLSSALAIVVGLVAVNLIEPGKGANFGGGSGEVPELATPSSPEELLLDIVPRNVVQAAADGDMLGLIFFAMLFGVAIASLPEAPQKTLLDFFKAAFDAMMLLTGWIIRLLPLGVFGLIVKVAASSDWATFRALGLYMITIAVALTVHTFVNLPLLLKLLGNISPRIHFRNMLDPLLLAFSTASSAATLPVTLRTVEKKVGVSNRVSSFVLPMGATVNMDGTALYECAGVLFIAQALGAELTLMQQATVVLMALMASIGAAAVPSAGLVVIFLVLEAVGLRGPQVDLIVGSMLAIDRPLDMYRTATNVFSDSCGAAIIAKSEGETGVDAE